jgi:hypothetical protein
MNRKQQQSSLDGGSPRKSRCGYADKVSYMRLDEAMLARDVPESICPMPDAALTFLAWMDLVC